MNYYDSEKELSKLKESCVEEIFLEKSLEPQSSIKGLKAIKEQLRLQIDEVLNIGVSKVLDAIYLIENEYKIRSIEYPEIYQIEELQELNKLSTIPILLQRRYEDLRVEPDEVENFTLRELLRSNESLITNISSLGEALMKEKRFKEAELVFNLLQTLDDNEIRFVVLLGSSQFYQGFYKEAIESYSIAEIKDPANPLPYLYEAQCHEKCGDLEKSIILVEHALSLLDETEPDLKTETTFYLNQLKAA